MALRSRGVKQSQVIFLKFEVSTPEAGSSSSIDVILARNCGRLSSSRRECPRFPRVSEFVQLLCKLDSLRSTGSLWDKPERRRTPTKLLRRLVWQRDRGICRICGRKVGQFDWELAHNRAHSRGGRLTVGNTFVAHSSCNRSQGTLTVKQTRRAIGLTTEEDDVKKRLRGLTVPQLRYLKSNHGVKVRGSVSEGFSRRLGQRPPRPSWSMLFLELLAKGTWLRQSHLGHNPRKRDTDLPLLGGNSISCRGFSRESSSR